MALHDLYLVWMWSCVNFFKTISHMSSRSFSNHYIFILDACFCVVAGSCQGKIKVICTIYMPRQILLGNAYMDKCSASTTSIQYLFLVVTYVPVSSCVKLKGNFVSCLHTGVPMNSICCFTSSVRWFCLDKENYLFVAEHVLVLVDSWLLEQGERGDIWFLFSNLCCCTCQRHTRLHLSLIWCFLTV